MRCNICDNILDNCLDESYYAHEYDVCWDCFLIIKEATEEDGTSNTRTPSSDSTIILH